MSYQINGLKDINKILMNNRRISGVVEVKTLRLRTGEVYHNAVITNIDLIRVFYLFHWIYDGGARKFNRQYQ